MKYLIIILLTLSFLACSEDSQTSAEKDSATDSDTFMDSDSNVYTYDSDSNVIILTLDTDSAEDTDTGVISVKGEDLNDCLSQEIPLDRCNNNTLLEFTGEVSYESGECQFQYEPQSCKFNEGCIKQEDADDHCFNPCDEITCDDGDNTYKYSSYEDNGETIYSDSYETYETNGICYAFSKGTRLTALEISDIHGFTTIERTSLPLEMQTFEDFPNITEDSLADALSEDYGPICGYYKKDNIKCDESIIIVNGVPQCPEV